MYYHFFPTPELSREEEQVRNQHEWNALQRVKREERIRQGQDLGPIAPEGIDRRGWNDNRERIY